MGWDDGRGSGAGGDVTDASISTAAGTLLLNRSDVARHLTLDRAIAAVERGFEQLGRGQAPAPGILAMHSEGGGFHIKAGFLAGSGEGNSARRYFAAKCNANFPGNPRLHGLPTIQGVVILCDAADGGLLALMDSMELTALRTAAATAVAARYLARKDSRVATICGCGTQGRIHLRALLRALPLANDFAYDADVDAAARFAADMTTGTGISVEAVGDLAAAARQSDVIVTCTPSRAPLLKSGDVHPGTFLAAVGADNPEKQELDPQLLRGAKLVVDSLEQCATIGELHHALAAGVLTKQDVHAELGELAAGLKPGRVSAEEITIFDSTGIAIEDAAAAIALYEAALANAMQPFRFGA